MRIAVSREEDFPERGVRPERRLGQLLDHGHRLLVLLNAPCEFADAALTEGIRWV